jgi:hypothetical protein
MSLVMRVAAAAFAGWLSATAMAQAPADFSGRWTADREPAPSAPAPGAAATPVRGDMGSGWGSPLTITQAATRLVVEQARFSRYDLQPPLRLEYALDGSESRQSVMIGHTSQTRVSRTAWEGQALRITTLYPAVDPASGRSFLTEVTYRLTLDSPTTLVVEVTRSGALGGRPTSTRTVYRKD